MMMAKEAWHAVTSTTIEHCWNHTEIQPDSSYSLTSTVNSGPHNDPVAWKIVHEFASSEMSLPEAETRLEHHLTDRYADTDWRPALKAIMDAEGDIDAALNAIRIPARPKTLTQVTSLETELMDSIDELKSRNRIFGKPPTVEELLDPVEEREVGGHDYEFPGGDKDIVEEV
ncbi:hypothetical protein EDD22DRAFT_741963, partial [Suillus occidentalis]